MFDIQQPMINKYSLVVLNNKLIKINNKSNFKKKKT